MFHDPFQEIREKSANFSITDAKKIENRDLNRYRDVNPFDHSRVQVTRGSCSYINASLIKVSKKIFHIRFKLLTKYSLFEGASSRSNVHINTRTII
jgi:Protein-tyrosine phosphatase